MKRLGDTWKDVCDIENGISSVVDGTRYKRGNREVQKLLKDGAYHEIDRDKAREYVEPIVVALKEKKWRHGNPRYKRQFCPNSSKKKGKWRDLYIPNLRDHTIGHMLMNANMKAFTTGMYPHSCGSVPGRGIKHVIRHVSWWMQHDKQCRYFVKLDIRKFFDNIDGNILKQKLAEKIKDKDSLWAFYQIIDSAPVPCPVGYYTSPWFANLYLQDFDWFVVQQLYKIRRGKRINYVRHYLRYTDDMLLIGTSKTDLEKAIKAIESFLSDIGLELKSTWEIKKIGKMENGKLKDGTFWCDIGGYKFCKDCIALRDGVFLSFRRLARQIKKRGYTPHSCRAIISKIGWAKHANSICLIDREIKPYINIKNIRSYISHVDKIEKRRERQTACQRRNKRNCNCTQRVRTDPGNAG